jgi:tetratricopeptide (TPR) repeat protein
VSEILPKEVLDEVRQTARPERFSQASRALAAAVAALAEEEGELAVEAGRAAKEMAPRSPSAREALGLALYQTGAFREARTELAAAQRMLGDNGTDLAAVLADIERALGRPERALEIFEHTDRERLGTDAAAELLLVAASAYGDLGKPASGAALIRRHGDWPAQLEDHHLRLSYAQAKLAQEAGDTSTARRALNRVLSADPDFFDAADRLDALDNPDRAAPASDEVPGPDDGADAEDPITAEAGAGTDTRDDPERVLTPDDTIDAGDAEALAEAELELAGAKAPGGGAELGLGDADPADDVDSTGPGADPDSEPGDDGVVSLDEDQDEHRDEGQAAAEAGDRDAGEAGTPAGDGTATGTADAAPELAPGDEEPGDQPAVIELDEGAADRT